METNSPNTLSHAEKTAARWAAEEVIRMNAKGMTDFEMIRHARGLGREIEREFLMHAIGSMWGYMKGLEDSKSGKQ